MNKICYRVYGDLALFSDPINNIGGEKNSYPVPTYGALKGITENIYWKPTFLWVIDRVKIVNPIKTYALSVKTQNYKITKSLYNLSYYTYLQNPKYIVEAHMEWNLKRPEYAEDRDPIKHGKIAERNIKRGGRFPIFLGASECVGFVEPCDDFDAVKSAYEGQDIPFGVMAHSYRYTNDSESELQDVCLWNPIMHNGIITFIRPEECPIKRPIIHKEN